MLIRLSTDKDTYILRPVVQALTTPYLYLLYLLASCILDHGHRVINHGHDSSHGTPQALLLSFESTSGKSRAIPEHQ